jgi:hypothetical protein
MSLQTTVLSEKHSQLFAALNSPQRLLTVKSTGRTEAPQSAEGAQSLSAQGADAQAHHGPPAIVRCPIHLSAAANIYVGKANVSS